MPFLILAWADFLQTGDGLSLPNVATEEVTRVAIWAVPNTLNIGSKIDMGMIIGRFSAYTNKVSAAYIQNRITEIIVKSSDAMSSVRGEIRVRVFRPIP